MMWKSLIDKDMAETGVRISLPPDHANYLIPSNLPITHPILFYLPPPTLSPPQELHRPGRTITPFRSRQRACCAEPPNELGHSHCP